VDAGVSIWIVLGLIVLLMVAIWVIFVGALAIGTWFIARSLPSQDTSAVKRQADDRDR
jgi:hypothetical protein